jgi:hypothetical protein
MQNPLDHGSHPDSIDGGPTEHEVHMAKDFFSPLPFIDFKAVNLFDPDDSGRRCRVQELAPNKHMLSIRSKYGYVTVGQATFPTSHAAIEWANMRYSLYGEVAV